MKLSQKIAADAQKFNICADGFRALMNAGENKDDIAELYFQYSDFTVGNDFPTPEYIAENFGDVATRHNILVDIPVVNIENAEKVACLGHTTGRICASGYNVTEVFVRHTSEMAVLGANNAIIMVDAFDNTNVTVNASENARIYVHRYGDARVEIISENPGQVKIIDKTKNHNGHK